LAVCLPRDKNFFAAFAMTYILFGCLLLDALTIANVIRQAILLKRLDLLVPSLVLPVSLGLLQYELLPTGTVTQSSSATTLVNIVLSVSMFAMTCLLSRYVLESKKQRQALEDSISSLTELAKITKMHKIAFDNAPLGIFQNTIEGKCICINTSMASIFGATSIEQMMDFHGDIANKFYVNPEERVQFVNRALAADGYVTGEFLERTLDGTPVYVKTMMRAVRDDDGKPLYLEGFLEDITERRLAVAALQRQSEYDDLIKSILSRFASSGPDDIDQSVEEALHDISVCFSADNSYLCLLSEDMSSYSCTHEWIDANFEPSKGKFQNVPVGTLPKIEEPILSDSIVSFQYTTEELVELTDNFGISKLPPNIKSVLIAPVHGVAGTIIGMVGLNSYRKSVTWTEKDIAQLRLVGDAVANVIERKRADTALKERAAFDELVAGLLAEFATCPSAQLDETIEHAIQKMATYIGADEARVAVLSRDRTRLSCPYEWCGDGVPPLKDLLQDLPVASLPWSHAHFSQDKVIRFRSINDLPADAVEERTCHYVCRGHISTLLIPIRNGEVVGTIGLATYWSPISWQDSDVRHLKVVGDAIASIIDRHRAEEEVRMLNSSLEQRIAQRTADLEEARSDAIQIMHDVDAQRRRAEEALRQLELATEHLRLLSQAVDSSPAMVMITDKSHLIEYVNPKFVEVTGYSAKEAIGKNPVDLLSAGGAEGTNLDMADALASGKHWSGEICSRRKSGELFWEYASFAPIKGIDDEVRHYVAVKEDITHRKALQDELTLARDEAEAANRTKSLFLANMSHEIRTPMNAILGFSQLLQGSNKFSRQQKQHIDIINRSGEHLLTLINDILEMSKVEAGRVTVHYSVVDFTSLITDLSVMFRMRCADKFVEFVVEQVDQLPKFVKTDENKLRQILTNLLGNAVKLTEKGRVVFRLAVKPDNSGQYSLLVEVEDTGPGIAPEERHKVFKPFEQTTSGIQSRSGTGLGLAISQQFAQMLNGEITFTSKLGLGTTFRLSVPIEIVRQKSPIKKPRLRRVAGLSPECKTRKVLFVDDDAENRLLLYSTLSEVGFETSEAKSGEEALRLVEEWHPDIILMDAQMPGLDGYEAIRHIRARHDGGCFSIIGMSASAFDEDRKRMIESGADEFLAKPLRVAILLDTIAFVSGVTYHYLDDLIVPTSSDSVSKSPAELKKNAASLPTEIASSIRQATIDADFDRVITLVGQIDSIDRAVADSLREMAEQYEATRIISLLSND